MHTIRYKGLVAQQNNYNYHVAIYKDGDMVMHSQQSKKLSCRELRGMINHYLALVKAMKGGGADG